MSGTSCDEWAEEIRDFLIGRLSARSRVESLPRNETCELRNPPIRRWWIFEGKYYRSLGGSLASNWDVVARQTKQLAGLFNPRLRISDRADGPVDWAQTLSRGPGRIGGEYIVSSSGIGLDESEKAAVTGWIEWIACEWDEYSRVTGTSLTPELVNLPNRSEQGYSVDRLRRWAHIARRSRWPLLRDVVAESIRPAIEPDVLDCVPLPSDPPKLFELLCLVRIARFFAPAPRELRWINRDCTDNILRLEGLTCHYQQALNESQVLSSSEYSQSLAEAVKTFGVGIPKFVDLAFDFGHPLSGFDGIIVEAKSGHQSYRATIPQLRTYRAARPRRPGSRYLIWGIVESSEDAEICTSQIEHMMRSVPVEEDVWLFSSAGAVNTVLQAVMGSTSPLLE